jgi:PAS domain S-box-containing protein
MLLDRAINKHRSEGALESLVRILQSSTEYSVSVTNLAGMLVHWNEGARRLYGYDAAEVLGRNKSEILHTPEDIEDDLPTVIRLEALRNGRWEGILSRVRKNGRRFEASAVLIPRNDTGGRHCGYFLISKEILDEACLWE